MVFKKTAKAGTTQKRVCGFRVGLPRLLEKLPISEQAIRKIRSANETHLLRFYFGTADTSDVDAIYTHLLISWGLAGRMSDAEAIRNEIWEAIRLVNKSLLRDQAADPLDLVQIQDTVCATLDLWRLTTVEELDGTIDEINAEFLAFRNRAK